MVSSIPIIAHLFNVAGYPATPPGGRLPFDASDVEYLANNLTERQLRRELFSHDVQRAHDVADRWPGYMDSADWWLYDYGRAVKQALDILTSSRPAAKTVHTGHIDIREVKDKADIVAIVSRYTNLRKTGTTFKGKCPFHNERTGSFVVYPDKGSWHCFGACSTGGDVISFVMLAEHTDFKGAAAILGGQ